MNIVQITPGAGAMYCGNCFRDNALVRELRREGHDALMVPLYLPLTLDEEDQSRGTPIFYNGVIVYLDQKSKLFRHAPKWVHRLFSSRALLDWASGRAAKTRASELGDITISMIRGEEGNQARELTALIAFLKTQTPPDIICLSNVLLAGMARRLKSELKVPIACALQGEDFFLDALPDTHRAVAWRMLAERCLDIDLFIPPSEYFASRMTERLNLPAERVQVIHDGINLDGYEPPGKNQTPPDDSAIPTLGFFARMCKEKGLDTLIEAYIILRERNPGKLIKLKIGGSCGPFDQPFVDKLRERLKEKNLLPDVEFSPNVDRAGKLAFLRSLTVFSVPALYGEAFGLYIIEALASGVPVVQPHHAAFPELVALSEAGLLCDPGDAKSLAITLEPLLLDAKRARALGEIGRKCVLERFNSKRMASETLLAFAATIRAWKQTANPSS